MKILHIFTKMNYVYTGALIDMFLNNIPEIEHEFLICDLKENVPETVKIIAGNSGVIHYLKSDRRRVEAIEIVRHIDKSDYTIFHFLPNNVYLHIMLRKKTQIYKKLIWRIWGADLYNWKKQGIQGLLFNRIREHTRHKIGYVVAEPMDILEYQRQFDNAVKFLDGPDPKGYDVDFLEKNRCKKLENSRYILVGHSAVPTLHHKDILEKLSKYRSEDIKIVLPLNYGNMGYAKEINKYAISIFGINKILYIKDKMDLDEYVRLLWKCDMVVVHSERQIAMGNITMMMYMQKKIFLMKNSIMDQFYRKDKGLEIYDSNLIGEVSFEEFISSKNADKNRQFAEQEINICSIADIWKHTFNYLEKEATWTGS